MTTSLFDRIKFGDKRTTKDGYLVTEARVARTGIQVYRGFEMGKPELDLVRVYRPPEEVFKDEAMASFTSIPMTLDHPDESVSAKNWKKYAVGFTGEQVANDGGYLRVPLALKDAGAIAAVEGGKAELSCGYDCDIEWTKGTAKDGEYDAIQRNIRGNHLAIVSAGRAGRECRIGDAALVDIRKALMDSKLDGNTMTLRTVVFDGISIETTDQGAQAIEKLQGQVQARDTEIAGLKASHKTALDAKDAELGTKDGEIETLKKTQLDESKIDALAEAKAVVLDAARKIAPESDFKGKSLTDIRKIAVSQVFGDAKIAGKSDAYVEALFDHLVDTVVGDDPIIEVVKGGTKDKKAMSSEEAWKANIQSMQDAWMPDYMKKGAN